LGCILSPTVSWTANQTVASGNGVFNEGSFTFSTNGTWIISFCLAALVTPSPNAIGGIFGFGGLAASAPYLTTNNGVAPNTNALAASSFVYNITSSITFTIFINVFSGSIYTNSGASTVTFTRIA